MLWLHHPVTLLVWNTPYTSCQEYQQLKVHRCILPPWELHLTKGKCFIQSYTLIPRGQPASNDYLIQVQRPNPLTSIGVVSKWPSQFQSSLQDWLKPLLQNYMYLHSTSSAACWYSCSLTGIAERTPQQPSKCKSQIQYLVFWGTQLQHMEETGQASQCSSLLHPHTHMTIRSLAGFLFPSVETHCKDQACFLIPGQNQQMLPVTKMATHLSSFLWNSYSPSPCGFHSSHVFKHMI